MNDIVELLIGYIPEIMKRLTELNMILTNGNHLNEKEKEIIGDTINEMFPMIQVLKMIENISYEDIEHDLQQQLNQLNELNVLKWFTTVDKLKTEYYKIYQQK